MSKSVELYKIDHKLDKILLSQHCIFELLKLLLDNADGLDQQKIKEVSEKVKSDTARLATAVEESSV